MVGRYGGDDPIPLAAAAFANNFIFISFVISMGMTFGLTPIIGELFTQGRKREMASYLQNGIILYTMIGVTITILQFVLIPLMWHLGQPDEVVAMSIPYYRLLVWSLLPVVIYFTFKQFLEGIGNTKVAMLCIVVSNIINVALNYMLIGGEWGAPELGVRGAGIATLISRTLTTLLILAIIFSTKEFRKYLDGFSLRNFAHETRMRLLKMGFPISAQLSLEVMAFVAIGFMFGWFDAAAIGAFQVAVTVGNASFMIVIAIGSATTIRISHSLGESNISQMRRASSAAWHLSIVWSLIIMALFTLLRHQIVGLFTTNEEIIELSSTLLMMIVIYQIPDALQCIGVSILRGVQDVKIIPVLAFISYWLCNMPVGYLCAFHLGMGPAGLYVGLIFGLSVASILVYRRIKSQQLKLVRSIPRELRV